MGIFTRDDVSEEVKEMKRAAELINIASHAKYYLSEKTYTIRGIPNLRQVIFANKMTAFPNYTYNKKGGYVSGYHNLSQSHDAWIADDAVVTGKAMVTGNAIVRENATVSDSHITDRATVEGIAIVKNQSFIGGEAYVNSADISDSYIGGKSMVRGAITDQVHITNSKIMGCAIIRPRFKHDIMINGSTICDYSEIGGGTITGSNILGFCKVTEQANVAASTLSGGIVVSGKAKVSSSNIAGYLILSGHALIRDQKREFGFTSISAPMISMSESVQQGDAALEAMEAAFAAEDPNQGKTQPNDEGREWLARMPESALGELGVKRGRASK